MRRHYLPHDSLELEEDVGDVEDGEKPLVPIPMKLQVFGHSCDTSIAIKMCLSVPHIKHRDKEGVLPNVGAIKERDKVYRIISLARACQERTDSIHRATTSGGTLQSSLRTTALSASG